MESGAGPVQQKQRESTANGIGEASGKFIYTEKMHGCCLHPDEERRFFPEGLIIELYGTVISRHDHLPCTLSKIDLIPVKERTVTQERQKYR
jgi:hypothetical protein